MSISLRLGALVIGLSVSGCALVGQAFVAPSPSRVGRPPADLGARDVRVASLAGPPLAGWYIGAPAGAPSVVLLHGVTDSRRHLVPRARLFRDAGFAVLLVDGRGHGESPPGPVTYGWNERLDAAAAVAFVRRRRPNTRVGVVGISLGGAGAALAAGRLGADAVVLESVFPTLTLTAARRLDRWVGPLSRPLLAALVRQAPRRLGVAADSVAPVGGVARLGVPVLVAAGVRDPYVTAAETQDLYDAAVPPKALWLLPDAGHDDLLGADPGGYRRHVLAFLLRHLAWPGP